MDEQLTCERGSAVGSWAGWSRGRLGVWVVLAAALVFTGCRGDEADESGAGELAAAAPSPESAAMGQEALQLEDLLIEQQLEVVRGEVERLDADAQALRNVANRKAAEVEALEGAVAEATGEAVADLETELAAARQEAEELDRMATQAEEELAEARDEQEEIETRKREKDKDKDKAKDICETKPSTSTTALTFNTCDELTSGAIPSGAFGSVASGCGGGGIGGGPAPAGAETSLAIGPLAGLDGYVMACGGSGNPTGREFARLVERVPGAFLERFEDETGGQVFVLVLPVEYTAEVFEIAAEEQVSILPTAVMAAVDEPTLITEILRDQPDVAAGLLNQEGFASLDQATIAELPLETKMAFKPSLVTQFSPEDFGDPVGADLAANFEDVSIGALHALDFEIVDMALQADPTIQGVLSTGQLETAGVPVPVGVQGDDTNIADDTTDSTEAGDDDSTDTTEAGDDDSTDTTEADDEGSGETTDSTSDSGTTVTTDPISDETETSSSSSSSSTTTTTVVPSTTTTAPTSTTTTEAGNG